MADFLQFLFSGLSVGAIYALVALGFALIYNASHVINFAQGEFVMVGGMATVFLTTSGGLALWAAIPLAVLIAAALGLALGKFAVEPAREASVVTLIIITIGASIFIRGLVEVTLGKNFHRLESFSGDEPIQIMGAALNPQSLWVLGVTAVSVAALAWFYNRTRFGKAMSC